MPHRIFNVVSRIRESLLFSLDCLDCSDYSGLLGLLPHPLALPRLMITLQAVGDVDETATTFSGSWLQQTRLATPALQYRLSSGLIRAFISGRIGPCRMRCNAWA
jgi:hypothetical protein